MEFLHVSIEIHLYSQNQLNDDQIGRRKQGYGLYSPGLYKRLRLIGISYILGRHGSWSSLSSLNRASKASGPRSSFGLPLKVVSPFPVSLAQGYVQKAKLSNVRFFKEICLLVHNNEQPKLPKLHKNKPWAVSQGLIMCIYIALTTFLTTKRCKKV